MFTESQEGQRPSTEQKDLYTCPEDFRVIWNTLSGLQPNRNRRGAAEEAQPEFVQVKSLPRRAQHPTLPPFWSPRAMVTSAQERATGGLQSLSALTVGQFNQTTNDP